MEKKKYRLVLASASPRRRDLLNMMGVGFDLRPTSADEKLPESIAPDAAVKMLAERKAAAAAEKAADDELIVAADTMVFLDGKLLGKPRDKDDAFRMLKMLSGRTHEVYSGLAVAADGRVFSKAVGTSVTFRDLSDEEILWYIDTGEPLDKAGAYGVQGRAAVFVRSISGEYHNVVGLPLCDLEMMLGEHFGLSLRDFAAKSR